MRKHRNVRPSGVFGRIRHMFRERQIYVRSRSEVQFVTVRPYMLVLGVFVTLGAFFWIAFASVNVTFKDELIALKERRLNQNKLDNEDRITELRRQIDRLNEKLLLNQDGYLREVDKVRAEYEQLVRRHERLGSFFRQGWMPLRKTGTGPKKKSGGKGGFGQQGQLRLNRVGKTGFAALSFSQKYTRNFRNRAEALKPLADLRRQMRGFEQLQVRLLDDVVAYARTRTRKTGAVYARLGVNPGNVLVKTRVARADSVGGPFVAAKAVDFGSEPVARRVRLAIEELDRAEALRRGVKRLPLKLPLKEITRISSRFGLRHDPFRRTAAMHTGIDLKAPYGAKVLATAPGVVTSAGWAGGYGRLVTIKHDNGVSTRFAHLARILVAKGERVVRGKTVGLLGSSGRSTGAHLHYETLVNGRAIDPTRFWKARHDFQALSKK